MRPHRTGPLRPAALMAALVAACTALTACVTQEVPATNRAPVAVLGATPTGGVAVLTVAFDGSGSYDPDGVVAEYRWTFGDGGTSSAAAPTHAFATPGTYTVRLTVTDDDGERDDALRTITVADPTATGELRGTLVPGATLAAAASPAGEAAHAGAVAATPAGEAAHAGAVAATPAWDVAHTGAVVPGEVIVRFAGNAVATVGLPATLDVDGVRLATERDLALPGTRLYRAVGLGAVETLALARRLAARPDVAWAQPNARWTIAATPNDPLYPRQWHYPAIGLPAAWDRTTGSNDVVVAVVDTGILHRAGDAAASHPDFVGRVLPGYDFVASIQVAGDGDGRDPDPYDVGDEPTGQSSYHGSHVAGTVGAASDDGSGAAGVDWAARLLPVRALGIGGGTLVDVVEGALWAAGFAVPGVPANDHPAHVINLSLGGAAPCGPYEQAAFDRIAEESPRHAIVVVAAGNEGGDVRNATPGSCTNVVTVGATDLLGRRAPYSNYGARIDLMAPGGDLGADANGDRFPDGVLSAVRDDGTGAFTHAWYQGTSMAAPHVAGLVALMKSFEPTLSLDDARALLQLTARPLTGTECGTGVAADCGAGLVDAAAALEAVADGPAAGVLAIEPPLLDFGFTGDEVSLRLSNVGGAPLAWAVDPTPSDPAPENPGPVPPGALTIGGGSPSSGVLGAGATVDVPIALDRSGAVAEGTYEVRIAVEADGVPRALVVRFGVGAPATTVPTGPTIVGAFTYVGDELVLFGDDQAPAFFTDYALTVLAGEQMVVAWVDENDDLTLNAGDYFGTYPVWVPVAVDGTVSGIDVTLERVLDVDTALSAAGPGAAADAVRAALERAALERARPAPQGR